MVGVVGTRMVEVAVGGHDGVSVGAVGASHDGRGIGQGPGRGRYDQRRSQREEEHQGACTPIPAPVNTLSSSLLDGPILSGDVLTRELGEDAIMRRSPSPMVPASIHTMTARPIVVPPGQGHRVGNVEFLARTVDTPRFNFAIIEIVAGRELEEHVHGEEDDAFYIVDGEMTFTFGDEEIAAPPGTFVLVPPGVEHGFRNDGDVPVRMLNIHAPAGFDKRIGLSDKD